ncbi:MAG TPA: hypothetical protein VF017_18095 [Thermoanaerobaculia bacterium]|nr:hypothetical protein [Thermoanaerobaculia bacterium]
MNRPLALAACLLSLSVGTTLADAATITWTRIGALAGAADIAGCTDGRIYVRTDDGNLHLNRNPAGGAAWERFTWVANYGSLTCANNVLYYFTPEGALFRTDGSPLGLPNVFVDWFRSTREIAGGTALAFIFPVARFLRLDHGGAVLTASDPTGVWAQVGTAGGAQHLAVGGGFMDWRAYAKNTDNSVWENAGQGCDPYWRNLGTRASLDDLSAYHLDRLIALDHDDSIHLGTITHERREIQVTHTELAAFANPLLAGTRLRAHGSSATFTPSGAMAAFGLAGVTFPLPEASFRWWEFGTTYSTNNINLSRFTIGLDGSHVTLDAVFEEAGLELLTSNGVFPNIDISDFRGRLSLSGQVGRCGQPDFSATGAVFNGAFHGVDNVFSFVVAEMNGGIRTRVQDELRNGGNSLLANSASQLALQQAMLGFAQFRTGGGPWSHIVGPTFRVDGGRMRFSVER